MGFKTIIFYCGFVCANLVQCQNVENTPLQQMLEYTKQFEHKRYVEPSSQIDTTEEDTDLQEDHLIKELFKEFLTQYQQLASEHKEAESKKTTSATTTTTTTTEIPFKIEVSPIRTTELNSVQPRKQLFSTVQFTPETTPIASRRRLSIKRKGNNPEAISLKVSTTTTPISVIPNTNFPSHEITSEIAKPFSPLRQKYITVDTRKKILPSTNGLGISPKFQLPEKKINLITKSPEAAKTDKNDVEREFDEGEFKHQAESAKYEFSSDIEDGINGNSHQREEVRDGLAVKGKYSYSDGYHKRTVYYEADDKGYRVVRQDVEPLTGPQFNPDGQAKVSTYVAGNALNYQITKDDILERDQKEILDAVPVLQKKRGRRM